MGLVCGANGRWRAIRQEDAMMRTRARVTDAAAASCRGAVGRTERNTWQGMIGRAQAGGAPGRVGGGLAPAKHGNAAEGRGGHCWGSSKRFGRDRPGGPGRAGWARLSLLLSAVRGRGSCRHADGCASGGRAVACSAMLGGTLSARDQHARRPRSKPKHHRARMPRAQPCPAARPAPGSPR